MRRCGWAQEIGPYEVGWKPREHSWAQAANLLFIDNPVGTGWSHVDEHGTFGAQPALESRVAGSLQF